MVIKRLLSKLRRIARFELKLKEIENKVNYITCQNDVQNVLIANVLIKNFPQKINSLHEVEFKVFSQWGDDGIIQYLIKNIDIHTKTFVEFGVQNYLESNTRFLLINNNWSGLIMDACKTDIDFIKADPIMWKYNLKVRHTFITCENINNILEEENFLGEVGILSIDIDGNDYWIWKAIHVINPVIVVIEYNSLFGVNEPITVPYNPDFQRTKAHYSNLYYGSSLLALYYLSKEKGYTFIGCNSAGNNAYFVRDDKYNDRLPSVKIEEGYVKSMFREARNKKGELIFKTSFDCKEVIADMPVYNIRENKIMQFKEII